MEIKTFRELSDHGKDYVYFFNISGGIYRGIVDFNGAPFGHSYITLRDIRKLDGNYWEESKDITSVRINLDSLDRCYSMDLENFYVTCDSMFYLCTKLMKFKSRIMAKKFSEVFDNLLMLNE